LKIANKKYGAAFFAVLLSLTLAAIFVFQRNRPAPEQAKSFHEKAHRAKKTAEEGAYAVGKPTSSRQANYYQAKSTRAMAERLRKMAEEANPETNIYANDKRVSCIVLFAIGNARKLFF